MFNNVNELVTTAKETFDLQGSGFKIAVRTVEQNSVAPEVLDLIRCIADAENQCVTYSHA